MRLLGHIINLAPADPEQPLGQQLRVTLLCRGQEWLGGAQQPIGGTFELVASRGTLRDVTIGSGFEITIEAIKADSK